MASITLQIFFHYSSNEDLNKVQDHLTNIFNQLYIISGIDSLTWHQIFSAFAIVAFAFLLEFFFLGWKDSSLKQIFQFDKSTRTDFILWNLQTLNLFNIIAFILTMGTCYYLAGKLEISFQFDLGKHIDNGYLQFATIFIISDLKNYIKHRFFHTFKPIWPFHAFHHSASHLSILTKYRDHFFEKSLSSFFNVLPFILLGAPIQTFIFISLLSELQALMIHSNLKHNWGIIGDYIFVSPAAHRVHHSANPAHFDTNYGTCLIIWDRIFGSYHPPVDVVELGIPNNQYNKEGFVLDIWRSIKDAITIKRA